LQIDFPGCLAARGYYVPTVFRCIPAAVPGPSQNRACTTRAHGSSSLPSLRSEQVHRYHRAWQGESRQEFIEFFPAHASPFPASIEPVKEQQPDLVGESVYPFRVISHPVVRYVPPQFRNSCLHQPQKGQRTALPKSLLEIAQLGLELLPRSHTLHPEAPAVPRPAAKVRQPQKVKRLGLLIPGRCLQLRQRAKLHDLGLLGRHLQSELGELFLQFRPKPLGVALALAHHEIVGIPNETRPAFARPGERPRKPQVKTVVKINISQHRRDISSLRSTLVRRENLPILKDPGNKKTLHVAQHPLVGYPVTEEFHHPVVLDIKKPLISASTM